MASKRRIVARRESPGRIHFWPEEDAMTPIIEGVTRRQFLETGTLAFASAALPKISPDPCYLEARELSRKIRSRELSAFEVMEAFLDRIEQWNPVVNAVVSLRPRDELLAEVREKDRELERGTSPGPLHGLPHAVKDLALTKGLRTTMGSPLFRDFVPDEDEIFVERLRAAGTVIIGKTNTPEFGAGSQTFNPVFGKTRNPYDRSKTCGGSSGGAAVALACGMVPLADGSDLGGSLRNPASFSNVVGFRPSPGRVAKRGFQPWNAMSVQGPMARSVADVAFLLSVMAGPDPRDPHALDEPGASLLRPLERDFRGVRIAWSETLGRYPVEPSVTRVVNAARPVLEELGCVVEDGEPDFGGADEAFQTLRAWGYANSRGPTLERDRPLLKDTVIWNTEKGLALTVRDIEEAEKKRRALYLRVAAFLERYEYLILPVSQVPPFSVDLDWVREVNGVRMETYIDWMATCYAITTTGLPAISVPCGFTSDGLPIGLQIVGRHHQDFSVLQLAHAFEQATRHGETRPSLG
jgi:amidase